MFRLTALIGMIFLSSVATREAMPGEVVSPPPFTLPSPKYPVRLEREIMVPMRDGVRLATDLYLPEGVKTRLPVILVRTPYNKKTWRHEGFSYSYPTILWPARFFAGQGYAVAVQDVRGKFESEGEYTFAGNDARDGYDATEWAATQPWSNGKVGTYGCSYLGEVQYQQATQKNPHLTALIPQNAGPMQYRAGGGIDGGALELAALIGWVRVNGSKFNYRPAPGVSRADYLESEDFFHPEPILPAIDLTPIWNSLPIVDMLKKAGAPRTDFEDIVSRDFSDPWWNKTDFIRPTDRFDVPALHVSSWYDYGVGETLKLFNQLRTNAGSDRARDNQFAIISPTTHCLSETANEHTYVGQRDLGNASLDYFSVYLSWFDYWLRGNESARPKMPKLQLYVMGKNQWRGENEWPLKRTVFTKYYLHSGGGANSRFGNGELTTTPPQNETPDRYTYDPQSPVPTVGGAVCRACASGEVNDGAADQLDVETRNDILVYTTPVLGHGVEVTGPIELTLYVSSSARDTDFTAKLVDVYPNGPAYDLQEGVLRARYREGFESKVLMKPGEVYPIRIDLHATSNYFAPGHRIRLEVSSSNFPRYDRNLNTGGNNSRETNWLIAHNVVHHSTQHPSHLILPIIPEK
jgi:uncharacterized protein